MGVIRSLCHSNTPQQLIAAKVAEVFRFLGVIMQYCKSGLMGCLCSLASFPIVRSLNRGPCNSATVIWPSSFVSTKIPISASRFSSSPATQSRCNLGTSASHSVRVHSRKQFCELVMINWLRKKPIHSSIFAKLCMMLIIVGCHRKDWKRHASLTN